MVLVLALLQGASAFSSGLASHLPSASSHHQPQETVGTVQADLEWAVHHDSHDTQKDQALPSSSDCGNTQMNCNQCVMHCCPGLGSPDVTTAYFLLPIQDREEVLDQDPLGRTSKPNLRPPMS